MAAKRHREKRKTERGWVGGNPLTPTDKMMVQLAGLLQRFSAQTQSAQRIDVTSIGIESCTRSLYAFALSLILLVAPCGVGRVLFQRVQPGRPYIMSPVVSQQTKKLHRSRVRPNHANVFRSLKDGHA